MIHYSTQNISKKLSYKLLSGSILPRPIAWVTTINQNNQVVNAAPFSFFNAVASELPLISLSILRKDGVQKDTAANILQNNELVIHMVNEENVQQMNQTAASLVSDQSEIKVNRIEMLDSKTVKVPSIKNAPIRMEAILHQYVPIKNEKDEIITDMFIAKVTDFFFDADLFDMDKEYILAESFNPVARLAGNTYATIDRYFELDRPK